MSECVSACQPERSVVRFSLPGWSAFPPLLILHRLAFSGSSAVVVLRSLPFSGNYRFRLWSRVAFAHAVEVTRTAGGHKPSNRTCTAQHISSYDTFEPRMPRAVVRQKLSLFLDFCVKIRPPSACDAMRSTVRADCSHKPISTNRIAR